MKTPTLEDLQTMSEGEFQGIIQQAIEELDAEEQPENFEELELIAFIGGYGGELYRAIREQGIKTSACQSFSRSVVPSQYLLLS